MPRGGHFAHLPVCFDDGAADGRTPAGTLRCALEGPRVGVVLLRGENGEAGGGGRGIGRGIGRGVEGGQG